jgi:hypothetical protein
MMPFVIKTGEIALEIVRDTRVINLAEFFCQQLTEMTNANIKLQNGKCSEIVLFLMLS